MTAQPHAQSYYAATANQNFSFEPLQGKITADVCVIGSGITGVSAALDLAEQGYRVVVLEAERVGWGASGRSGGQAIFGWGCEQYALEKMVGLENAKQFWNIAQEGLELTKSSIRKHQIDCDWRDGMAHLGLKPRHDRELKEWQHKLENTYGYSSLTYWDQNAVREHIGSPLYTSGLFDQNSGHLHPLNYTLGLVKAAQAAGVQFYEDSRVISLKQGDPARVQTAQGEVTANYVLMACNAYLEGLSGYLVSRVMPVGTYIAATKPLGKDRCEQLMKDNIAACDINFVLDYYRCSADHRMLFGGRVSYSGIDPRNLEYAMRPRMEKVFPQLKGVEIDYTWGGFVGITMNRAPHFGKLASNIFYAQGFSGHGIAATNIAGKLMSEAIVSTSERLDLFSKIPHRPFPGGRLFRTPALVLAMAYFRIRDRL
ncbi:NAD(P)/FAD-dependent oxidoreductase [Celerinatantimonas sp. YJH-8]|uniref:NAD(P)/FAD-dependent oxidoreductase n=1 Tax=Celerinatantimonas sp. YJH-8 TaxID=3228714 RepID=UPI0038C092EC